MVNCPVCGREVDGKKFCPNCGSAVMEEEKPADSQNKSKTKYCSNCGAEIDIPFKKFKCRLYHLLIAQRP